MDAKTFKYSGHTIQTIQVYLYYRLVVACLLFVMFFMGVADNVLASHHKNIYQWTSLGYLGLVLLSLIISPSRTLYKKPRYLHFLLSTDIIAQFILIHASNGMESGLPFLLLISAAMTSMFLKRQFAFAYAATMSITLLVDTWLLHNGTNGLSKNIFSAGLLGLLLFAVTFALSYLTNKLQQQNTEAEQQSRRLRNLQETAQSIVTRMQTGILVIGHDKRIELMNSSAKQLFEMSESERTYHRYITDIPKLTPLLEHLQSLKENKNFTIISDSGNRKLRISNAYLNMGENEEQTIFYIEDYGNVLQHAQQLKLASLGRLTASIAHEIRNPLGALSHAAQLLNESEALPKAEQRMTEIILNNSARVNEIIENTLDLSRRKEPSPEQLNLATWLPHFINDNQAHNQGSIDLHVHSSQLLTKFDPTHLSQILSNLVDNGLRHSQIETGKAQVEIHANVMNNDEKAYIEVIDVGGGISEDKQNIIFEPFYTTEDKGSGLGLYISKELAEINNANLSYQRNNKQSCFRIDFSHYQRMR
ncbi:PAS domain-containing sensor histidine kinase [Agaribacterium sp. ZY112]|uniref:sensor histidine kinase n=1 Tax=Agaribacterium sp. ZY112 TaxID=3233574 RepID=UPI0035241CEE